MATVVQRIGHQTGLAETLGNMVVAAGMFAETVRQHHDRSRRGVRRPDVVDDAHATDAVEIPFSAGRNHYGQRNGSKNAPSPQQGPGLSRALRRLLRVRVLADQAGTFLNNSLSQNSGCLRCYE